MTVTNMLLTYCFCHGRKSIGDERDDDYDYDDDEDDEEDDANDDVQRAGNAKAIRRGSERTNIY